MRPELHEQFDAVIEAGSLEQIFNFPILVGNLMRMLKTGGCLSRLFNAIPRLTVPR